LPSQKLITIIGPTAIGKTNLAVNLALSIDAEIISADSRQVYRRMDIGTGKDLSEYKVDNCRIPYHLIDIKNAGEEYDVFQFQNDFYKAFQDINSRNKIPILCGGSGMYIEAALNPYKMIPLPDHSEWRDELLKMDHEELIERLNKLRPTQHNTTDLTDMERTIRAIEIESLKQNQRESIISPLQEYVVFGLNIDRDKLRERIKLRLDSRLEGGMIEEVKNLIADGVSKQSLFYYGLEYRFISSFLTGEITYEQMYVKLLQAIRRFAKKQMTWFRRMERNGIKINWIDAELNTEQKVEYIKASL